MRGVSCIDFSMNGLLLKMNEKLLTSQQKTSWMSDNVFWWRLKIMYNHGKFSILLWTVQV